VGSLVYDLHAVDSLYRVDVHSVTDVSAAHAASVLSVGVRGVVSEECRLLGGYAAWLL
jgi:hypothetical protein